MSTLPLQRNMSDSCNSQRITNYCMVATWVNANCFVLSTTAGISPLDISGLIPGMYTFSVVPVKIDGCYDVKGRSLVINVPN